MNNGSKEHYSTCTSHRHWSAVIRVPVNPDQQSLTNQRYIRTREIPKSHFWSNTLSTPLKWTTSTWYTGKFNQSSQKYVIDLKGVSQWHDNRWRSRLDMEIKRQRIKCNMALDTKLTVAISKVSVLVRSWFLLWHDSWKRGETLFWYKPKAHNLICL